MLQIMFINVGRKIVDLDRTEQKAQSKYRRTLHHGCVAAERALCVHYKQRHLHSQGFIVFHFPGSETCRSNPLLYLIYRVNSIVYRPNRQRMRYRGLLGNSAGLDVGFSSRVKNS